MGPNPHWAQSCAQTTTGRDGSALGVIIALTDLREVQRTAQARRHLEVALEAFGGASGRARGLGKDGDEVIGAGLTNASLPAMDIADAAGGHTVAPLLEELEASARRATALVAQIRSLSD